MVPAPAAGRGRAVVRRRRLVVEEGSLVLTTEDGRREVLAGPGEVVSATWVPEVEGRPEAVVRETLELVRRDAPTLALPLDDWLGADDRVVPAQPDGSAVRPLDATGSVAMRISGAAAVAASLGVTVGSGKELARGADEVAAGAQVPWWIRLLVHAWIVPAVSALALGVAEVGSAGLVVGLLVAMGVLVLVSLSTSLLAQARLRRDLRQVELPVPPVRPDPEAAASRAHVRHALVSAGRDWLVVRDEHGRESWTPGPGLGGVRTVRVRGAWLAFENDQGEALQRIWWPAWGDVRQRDHCLHQMATQHYAVLHDDGPEPTGPLWRPPPRPGGAEPRDRDGTGGSAFPAGSAAPFVTLVLVELVRNGQLPAAAAAAPAVASALALVAVMGALRRSAAHRQREARELEGAVSARTSG
jgi:hypothetical protein